MKTFLLNIPQRLRIESQKLDAQAVLCDKAWSVFNDEGIKQLFIFQPDGSLMITINGDVSNSTWKYLPVNNSVVLTSEGKSTMFHPAFIDKVVFALEKDGGAECLFMIDEKNQEYFSPKTLSDLKRYFIQKELLLLEQERKQKELERQRQMKLAEERRREAERIRAEEERVQKELDEQRKQEAEKIKAEREAKERKQRERAQESYQRERAKEIKESLHPYGGTIISILLFIASPFIVMAIEPVLNRHFHYPDSIFIAIGSICLIDLFLLYIISIANKSIEEERIMDWKRENPNDPCGKYL